MGVFLILLLLLDCFSTTSGRLRMEFKFRPVRWPDSVTGSTIVDSVNTNQAQLAVAVDAGELKRTIALVVGLPPSS